MDDSENEKAAYDEEFVQEIAYIMPDAETTCNICHAEFLDSEDLTIHVKQVHEGSAAYIDICQFCEETYKDLDSYACHIRDVHFFDLKCCRHCTKCFIDLRTFKKHERKHHSKSGMYACSQCTGLYSTQREIRLHEIVNHDNTFDGVILKCMPHLSALLRLKAVIFFQMVEKDMTCHACNYTSLNVQSYFAHLNNNTCVVYVCDLCSNAYKQKKYLVKHFQSKTQCLNPKDINEFTKCRTCNKAVLGPQMQAHLNQCKVYKCETCNIRFDSIDQLSAHQAEAHPLDLQVIKCEFCSKEYVGRDALDKHVERSHRHMFILYKYACRECGAIFKHPQKLFAHYFTKHKELEPYTCRICDKKFRIRKNFTIHIKLVHKGEGVVEFDKQYHVFFADKKSEQPFIPTCVVPELVPEQDNSKSKKLVYLTSTEAESEEPRIENTKKKAKIALKPKLRKSKRKKNLATSSSSDEEETQPLVMIKKKAEKKSFQIFSPGAKRAKKISINRKQFTCKVCNKYCYTYQNYHNHIKTHSKNELIQCIKCSRSFKTKSDLTEHFSTDHATSRLIETLKSVLERKQGDTPNVSVDDSELTNSERFMKTLVKVKADKTNIPAKIQPSTNSLVKNFIENFVPDVSAQKEIEFEPVVTIKHYDSPFYRKRCITLSKFTPEIIPKNIQLKMPEKFQAEPTERIKLSVRLVQQPIKQSMFDSDDPVSYDNGINDNFQEYDDFEYRSDVIPEVAQEVMLEGSEEPPKGKSQSSQMIDLPKLPKGYPNLHIATLQPQAPFFKIIKIRRTNDDCTIISGLDKPEKSPERDEIIRLPDGTKFVPANPLAHLLGNKPVEEVLEPLKNKHYTPARTNYKGLLATAIQNLGKRKVPSGEKRPRKRD